MTTITILPEKENRYRAVAGDKESTGRTAGEALDALAAQLKGDESGTLVIVQNYKPDQFFDAAQQERLTELMQLREGGNLSPEEEGELESLVEAELDAARRRVEQKLPHREEDSAGRALTLGEKEILDKLLQGRSVREIAETLRVNPSVLRTRIAKLYARLKETGPLAKDSKS